MEVVLIIVAIIIIVKISKKKPVPQTPIVIDSVWRTNASYSSILNTFQHDIEYLTRFSRVGISGMKVAVCVSKIDNIHCRVSGNFGDANFSEVNFKNGYTCSGDWVQFEINTATGFTTPEDVVREMQLQFNWSDIQVYNTELNVYTNGEFANQPLIAYHFEVRRPTP